jgi:hypothetical protein
VKELVLSFSARLETRLVRAEIGSLDVGVGVVAPVWEFGVAKARTL